MKRLLIVESPTKARTIGRFLKGDEYQIEASMGHVRDLPASAAEIPAKYKKESWAQLGIRTDGGFRPLYVIPPGKKKIVTKLKSALREADELLIATDEDREGESIGWHLLEVLRPRIPHRRMVFHEITRSAIESALARTREINKNLVNAQEARRVLDRLVGYTISPVLWRKIAPKLSAGRVQSVAVRLLVMRERDRIAFIPASYWGLKTQLAIDGKTFEAVLVRYQERRLATGRDFADATGKLKSEVGEVLLLTEKQALRLAADLSKAAWVVDKVDVRTRKRKPAPPFITSTLQQEASRKLRMGAQRTMRVAQRLYERGLITYMRTDSVHLSEEAVGACRRAVKNRYGAEYLSPEPRQFKSKVRNAQEAHEAIRPAGNQMKPVSELNVEGQEARLYDLIWKRTVATQMADARLRLVTASIRADTDRGERAMFRASGRTVEFPGFFRAYVEGSDNPEATIEDRDQPLPDLHVEQVPAFEKAVAQGHETKPPARYTEASLIKMLEQEGIGRPSTYASILSKIESKGSVVKSGNALVPTFTAFATNRLLEDCFEPLVNTGFTAGMEQVLDDIAAGRQQAEQFLKNFFRGEDGLEKRTDRALSDVDAKDVSTISFPQWGPFVIRVGLFGPYVEGEVDGETERASVPAELLPADVTEKRLAKLLRDGKAAGSVLGIHPDLDRPILLKKGPYGPYVQLGDDESDFKPRRMSLPKGTAPDSVTLAVAVKLLSLPRLVGTHPETGHDVRASIGRYGPYVQHGNKFASLKKEDDVYSVGLDRALELLAAKEAASKALLVLGQHPQTGQPIEVWKGRYGPYVKHGKLNATLRKDQVPEAVTLEEALGLLEERAKKKKRTRRRGRKRAR